MKWDVKLYEKFNEERLQPIIDLIHRIPEEQYKKILDVGCGSGMSTVPLVNRFPKAEVIGVDASREMLNKAKDSCEEITWIQKDCSKPLTDLGTFDLIFSNAFLQWLQDQEVFLKNITQCLNPNGILALQVPNYDAMPVKQCVDRVIASYGRRFEEINKGMCHNHTLPNYYDILSKYYEEISIWQTNYAHIIESYEAIVEFVSGTGLRPYLQEMEEEEKESFKKALITELKKVYPIQRNGKIIFTFERIEFIAKKNKEI